MPWEGDRFIYKPATVRAAMLSFLLLRESALEDPVSQAACSYYDMLRAVAGLRLTRKQWEALSLRLSGMTYVEIGDELGITWYSVRDRLRWVEKKIKKFLINDPQEPPETCLKGEG